MKENFLIRLFLVFNNPGERKKLEELVWPAIETLCKKEISKAYESGHSIVVVEGYLH